MPGHVKTSGIWLTYQSNLLKAEIELLEGMSSGSARLNIYPCSLLFFSSPSAPEPGIMEQPQGRLDTNTCSVLIFDWRTYVLLSIQPPKEVASLAARCAYTLPRFRNRPKHGRGKPSFSLKTARARWYREAIQPEVAEWCPGPSCRYVEASLSAMLMALVTGKKHRARDLIVYSDSPAAVDIMNKRRNTTADATGTYLQARALAHSYRTVLFYSPTAISDAPVIAAGG